MNDYTSLRQKNTVRLPAALLLLVCVVLTGSMLFSRLIAYAPADTRHYIPLTQGNGLTHVTAAPLDPDALAAPLGMPRVLTALPWVLTANPGFQASDKNTVWTAETDIEIFRITYENGTGNVTVNSQNGDALLAPGTSNTYDFVLENTGNVDLQYTLTMEAFFSHGDYPIPVSVRLTDRGGEYLLGTEEEAVDVLRLNEVSREGTIRAGYLAPYSLQWEWPFELDDEYDTMLGNLATEQDITLTIVIRTTASYTETPDPNDDEPPKTGDTTQIAFMFVLMVGSLAGLLVLLLLPRRKREERHG